MPLADLFRGLSIIEILNQVSDDLKYFGGHAGAAGFVCEKNNFENFTKNITNIANSQKILAKTLHPDAWINPKLITDALIEFHQKLAPFGIKNSVPIFGFSNVFITEKKILGKTNEHHIFCGFAQDNAVEFLSFFTEEKIKNIQLNQYYQVLFSIKIDYWKGQKKIKFRLVDIKK